MRFEAHESEALHSQLKLYQPVENRVNALPTKKKLCAPDEIISATASPVQLTVEMALFIGTNAG